MRRSALLAAALTVACATRVSVRAADADSLVGIHFWGLKQGTNSYYQGIDEVPAQMLDSRSRGAWDVEVVNTHGDPWQKAEFFQPLFNDLYQDKKVSLLTRIEYQYGKTVPSPSTINTVTWAGDVVDTINKLNNAAHIWQLGNEPNLIGEGNGWANNQVTPSGYASIYKAVRDRIQTGANVGAAGRHQLLVAPVSPGGVISGVRWEDGSQWLGETLDAIRATGSPVDGVGLHAYGGGATAADTLTEFRRSFAEQVAVVDAKNYNDVPLYITEWNTYADPSNPNAQEAKAAEFARSAFKTLDRWNRTPGNHNVVSAGWFVYDMAADDRRWDGYSLEYWKDRGNPAGSTGDLFTAFSQAARAGYKAGLSGTRPLPAGVHIIDDFETNDGHFTWTPTQSPTSVGASASSFKVRTADDSYTKSYAQKIGVVDDATNPNGWYVRHVSGGGAPSANESIPLTAGPDGSVGFFLRVLTNSAPASPLSTQLILDSGATGGGADSDAGVARAIVTDGDWHYYEWDLDRPSDWTAWRDANGNVIAGSDGVLPASGPVSIDSIVLRGSNANVEFLLDGVMRNANGSLAVMLPVPEPMAVAWMPLGLALFLRRRQRK